MKKKLEDQPKSRAPRRSPPRESLEHHVDPSISSVSEDSETLALAYNQTLAARACLYWPSTQLKYELSYAASGLLGYIKFLGEQKDGDALIIGLCARVFGPEGLDPQEFMQKGVVEDQGELAGLCRKRLLEHLVAISEREEGPELGHARAITIALMGDIGAFMTATGATTGTTREETVSKRLKETFSIFALLLEGKNIEDIGIEDLELVNESVQRAKKLGGGEVVGPTKSKERARVSGEELIPRTGIHDCGNDVDEALGRFQQPGHLVPTKWASARLHKNRVDFIDEPLAGHMSASPSEILHTWDLLSRRGLKNAYIGTPRGDDLGHSFARAAGASAFLVGCGYHSALEVLHGTMIYLGQEPELRTLEHASHLRCEETGLLEVPLDLGSIFHAGAATNLVEDLLEDMTSKVGREKRALATPIIEELDEELVEDLDEEEQQSSSLLNDLKSGLGKFAIGVGITLAFVATIVIAKNTLK